MSTSSPSCRTETEKFSPEQDLRILIEEQRGHPLWGGFATDLLDNGKYRPPRQGTKDDQVSGPGGAPWEGKGFRGSGELRPVGDEE